MKGFGYIISEMEKTILCTRQALMKNNIKENDAVTFDVVQADRGQRQLM